MNFNSKQEDLLKLLADLINVMRDPEGMQNMMADANKAVDEYKKYKEENRRIGDVDEWYKGLCEVLDKREDKLVADEKAFVERIKKNEDAMKEKNANASEQMAALSAQAQHYAKKLEDVAYVDAEMKRLNDERLRLQKWDDELQFKAKEMKEKLDKVEKAWGAK